jgi:hypothetical protein
MGLFMSKKTLIPFLLTAAAIALAGCKGTNESNGDKYLKEGKYRNAVNSYTNALTKGKVSKGFYDNFVIAYISAAKQTANKNATDDIIRSYVEQIFKNMPNVKGKAAIDSVVQGLAEIGRLQASSGMEYEYTLQGFRNLDSAVSIAKRSDVNAAAAEANRKKAESAIVKKAIEDSEGAANSITAEYVLLEAEVLTPKNADLQNELNKVRIKNRGMYLIFAEEIIGQKASRLVDKYGYVISFPILNIGSTGTNGEIAIWNATGNNVDFDLSAMKMVSTDGKEASTKVASGWCFMSDHTGKMKSQFKGSVGKLLSELSCQAKVSFNYSSGFIPDYVDIKDKDGNIGRKYFGYKK